MGALIVWVWNVTHKHLCLNAWFSADSTLREVPPTLRHVAELAEVGHRGWSFKDIYWTLLLPNICIVFLQHCEECFLFPGHTFSIMTNGKHKSKLSTHPRSCFFGYFIRDMRKTRRQRLISFSFPLYSLYIANDDSKQTQWMPPKKFLKLPQFPVTWAWEGPNILNW